MSLLSLLYRQCLLIVHTIGVYKRSQMFQRYKLYFTVYYRLYSIEYKSIDVLELLDTIEYMSIRDVLKIQDVKHHRLQTPQLTHLASDEILVFPHTHTSFFEFANIDFLQRIKHAPLRCQLNRVTLCASKNSYKLGKNLIIGLIKRVQDLTI